jgi:hypothetical protein
VLGVCVVEVFAAQAVDPAEHERAVLGVLLQGCAHLEREVAATCTVRITAVADDDGAHVPERFAEFVGRKRAQQVGRHDPDLATGLAQPVGSILGGFRSGVKQDDGDLGIVHAIRIHNRVAAPAECSQLRQHRRHDSARSVHRQ